MSRVSSPALLVGSVPLATVEDVLETCGHALGDRVAAYPDGEVDDRINWVFYLAVRTYADHPDLEVASGNPTAEVRQPENGLSPQERAKTITTYRVREGVETLEFPTMHYSGPATASYRTFCQLRERGTIPAEARFQVSLPASGSGIMTFFADPDDWPAAYAAYRRGMVREIGEMLEVIPPEDLVIQWDIAAEMRDLYAGDDKVIPWAPDRTAAEKWAAHLSDIGTLAGDVPEEVVLGYHLCFGTWGGWPHTPGLENLGVCVRLANEILARASRPVDYIHLPMLPDAGDAFVAPLGNLQLGDTRLFVGLVYHDGVEGARRRAQLIGRHVEDFGVAWYCGFGRLPAHEVRPILDHIRSAVDNLSSSA